jgi:pentatricopeptide repeat protein
VQATLIHFYGYCGLIDHAKKQFRLSDQSHIASWNTLLAGLLRKDLMHEARQLFDVMPERDIVSCSTMISLVCIDWTSRYGFANLLFNAEY